ncbi:hypothetical protein FGO68_gene9579 [Halteria grandinella]|uniref:Uncharacterized protein n=1 Tax=Halteria grandinella TaxID=5974 RepID=A0A8J8NIL7_HALGN|nr:hypothetical protein FGO68_gene9579 [Halteria grandinella]
MVLRLFQHGNHLGYSIIINIIKLINGLLLKNQFINLGQMQNNLSSQNQSAQPQWRINFIYRKQLMNNIIPFNQNLCSICFLQQTSSQNVFIRKEKYSFQKIQKQIQKIIVFCLQIHHQIGSQSIWYHVLLSIILQQLFAQKCYSLTTQHISNYSNLFNTILGFICYCIRLQIEQLISLCSQHFSMMIPEISKAPCEQKGSWLSDVIFKQLIERAVQGRAKKEQYQALSQMSCSEIIDQVIQKMQCKWNRKSFLLLIQYTTKNCWQDSICQKCIIQNLNSITNLPQIFQDKMHTYHLENKKCLLNHQVFLLHHFVH